jgi:hypothetical protein
VQCSFSPSVSFSISLAAAVLNLSVGQPRVPVLAHSALNLSSMPRTLTNF